jgi:hypothetical protein
MLAYRMRSPGLVGLWLMAGLAVVAAQSADTTSTAQRAAPADTADKGGAPSKAANPFPDNGKGSKSSQPCEVMGPCGKCDCPAPRRSKKPDEKKK